MYTADKSLCAKTFCNQVVVASSMQSRNAQGTARRDSKQDPCWGMHGSVHVQLLNAYYLYSQY